MVFNGRQDGGGISTEASLQVPLTGSDQLYFAGTSQWCCWSGVAPILNIGGALYGEGSANAENEGPGGTSWDSVTVTASTGAKELIANGELDQITSTATGDATATIVYSVNHGGRTFTVERDITYNNPDNWYDEVWTITIPTGNTEVVKFYLGGDAQPGSSDYGSGEKVTIDGKVHLREKNPDSGVYVSYQELGSTTFDHYFVGDYEEPYDAMRLGNNLPDTIEAFEDITHDAGIQIQWTFGSTPGAYSETMRTRVGFLNEIDEGGQNGQGNESLATTGMNSGANALAVLALATLVGAIAIRRRARV
jgi:hypothetical protein